MPALRPLPRLLPAALLCAAAGLWGLPSLAAPEAPVPAKADPKAELAHCTGITLPVRDVPLGARIDGRIAQVPVTEGTKVAAGDLLVQLDDREQALVVKEAEVTTSSEAEIEAAKALAVSARWLYDHTLESHKNNASSDYEVEQARSKSLKADSDIELAKLKLEQAKAHLEVERARLDKHKVLAPFAGIVRKVEAKPGKSVQNGAELLTLTSLDPLRAEIHLPGTLYEKFKVGDACRLQAGAPVNRLLGGKVAFKDPVLDPASGTFRCLIEIPNPELLPAGWTFTLDSEK